MLALSAVVTPDVPDPALAGQGDAAGHARTDGLTERDATEGRRGQGDARRRRDRKRRAAPTATVTLGRRPLQGAGHGAVAVRRTMEVRELRAIAWLLHDAAQNGALPAGTRKQAGDWSGRLEARIAQGLAAPSSGAPSCSALELATIHRVAANVAPYVRADGVKVWSLMQLERQLRPEAFGRRRGGYADRRRARTMEP